MQFSAVLNIFIVKTYLNSTFTNDLKRKYFFFRKIFIVTEYAALTKVLCYVLIEDEDSVVVSDLADALYRGIPGLKI